MKDKKMSKYETKFIEFDEGQTVKIDGIPFKTTRHTLLEGSPKNLELVKDQITVKTTIIDLKGDTMSFEEDFPSLMEKVETVVESRMGTKLPLSYHKYEVDEDSGEKMFMMEYIRKMSFEEDFPSLKDKVFNIKSFVEFDGSEGENSEGELSKFVLLKVVKNNCNDKAKSVTHEELRKAIEELKFTFKPASILKEVKWSGVKTPPRESGVIIGSLRRYTKLSGYTCSAIKALEKLEEELGL